MIDEAQFWQIIDAGGPKALADSERQLVAVRTHLRRLSPEEVRQFHQLYMQKLVDAYTWDLWGAAYLINGGCSDDGFEYFRDWLISRGQVIYEAAVENPDTLAGITDPRRDGYEFEELGYVALHVYEELTSDQMPQLDFQSPTEPKGDDWDFDDNDEVSRRLPQLARLYRQ